MNYSEIRKRVCAANLALVKHDLVLLTWGNVSAVDREKDIVAIKPSGIKYEELTPQAVCIVSLETGEKLDGLMKPSSDTSTHLEIYRRFPRCGGVVHTHSTFATIFAQACIPIPCLGTTHADTFYGPVPVTRLLRADEAESEYELNTGRVIVETFAGQGIDPAQVPGVLVAQHGPFTWGATPEKALENALVLEETARMAFHTLSLRKDCQPIPQYLLDRHFLRKHGPAAYYGQ